MTTSRVLIVAGSDSGGGAGIQADIRTVTMLGGHPTTAITAITAQNTLGVQAVHAVPADVVVAQMRSVLDDIGTDAVKIGMIGSAATAHAVADVLAPLGVPVVFDPVMVATSGSVLADEATVAAFERLMAMATLVTPNVPELAALAGADGDAATALAARIGTAVLAKGGDATGEVVHDRLALPDGQGRCWSSPRIGTTSTHGTGCTLASAIAAGLARGLPLAAAIDAARTFVRLAMHDAPGLGAGHGPMAHQAVRLDGGAGARFNQVTLPLDDYGASVDFYAALGLRQIVGSGERYARFEAAGGATLSVARGEGAAVYFEHDDLDAAVAAARARGVTFDAPPEDRTWGWREAWTRDPAGNRVCLYHAGENRRFPPWRLR